MRRFASILLSTAILLAASGSSHCQSYDRSSSPNKPKEPEPDIKVNSRLVVVDVVVWKGKNPVPGLQQSDFTLSEDGVPQPIRHFTPHFADDRADAANSPAAQPPALPLLNISRYIHARSAATFNAPRLQTEAYVNATNADRFRAPELETFEFLYAPKAGFFLSDL